MPCAFERAPLILTVSLLRSFFTWSGAIDGYFSRTSAAAPDTTAAASDVPLPRKYGPKIWPAGSD